MSDKKDYKVMSPLIKVFLNNWGEDGRITLEKFKEAMLDFSYEYHCESVGRQFIDKLITDYDDDFIVSIGKWGDEKYVVILDKNREYKFEKRSWDDKLNVAGI